MSNSVDLALDSIGSIDGDSNGEEESPSSCDGRGEQEQEAVVVDVNRKLLVKFFKLHLGLIPEPYVVLDTSRITVIYFCVVGLDLLSELDSLGSQMKAQIIDFVYAQQLSPPPNDNNDKGHRGFLGPFQGQTYGQCLCCVQKEAGKAVGSSSSSSSSSSITKCSMEGHLAMSYTSLAVLRTLRDDFSRVNREALLQGQFSLSNIYLYICIFACIYFVYVYLSSCILLFDDLLF
jgi:hypothetical protein